MPAGDGYRHVGCHYARGKYFAVLSHVANYCIEIGHAANGAQRCDAAEQFGLCVRFAHFYANFAHKANGSYQLYQLFLVAGLFARLACCGQMHMQVYKPGHNVAPAHVNGFIAILYRAGLGYFFNTVAVYVQRNAF